MLCMSLSFFALGQQADNSPYSRYGIGDITDNNFNHLRQVAGLGASFIDGYHINIVNPASHAFLNATAFDVGLFAKYTSLQDRQTSGSFWSGNLEYLSLAFPLKNPINEVYDGVKKDYKLGMSFTLMPHSNVSYNIEALDSLGGTGNFSRRYEGTGGSYKVVWGNAIKYKDFALGLNLGYLFGRISNDRYVTFSELVAPFNDRFSTNYNISGFLYNAGFLYTKVINKAAFEKNRSIAQKRISVGLNVNSATGFSTSSDIFDRSVQQLPGLLQIVDTIRFISEQGGKGRLPAEFGIGSTYYYGEKSAIGVNFSWAGWSRYFNDGTGEREGSLSDSYKLSIGGYVRPDYKSFDNFFKRVYYRYGLYYQKDPRLINQDNTGNEILTYGITTGLGMPFVFQRKISYVNLGANFGVRGQGTPVSEKFVKISLGVTFNDDEWFLKRKYN